MYTVAVGGNRLGRAEAGIKVRSVVIRNFIALHRLLAGLVGVLEATRASSVTPGHRGRSGDDVPRGVAPP